VRRVRPDTYLFFFACFALILAATHLPHLGLPFYWDELGYFVPAARDLHRLGLWIPHSAMPNVHPPGLMLYLAGAWSLCGYSIPVTRAAMLVVAAAAALVIFLLAIQLCRGLRGAPAIHAVLLVLISPLLYTQAMLAQLDLPAMLLTCWALLAFLQTRFLTAALISTALVLVKETGVVVPAVFACWLWREGKPRQALYFLLPLAALAGWLAALAASTGQLFGSREFTHYNVFYSLHPVRAGAALLRRLYYLLIGNFHWAGWLAVWWAARREGLYSHQAWKVAASLAGAHVLAVSLLGGAALERYLLPVLPLAYIAMAAAWSASASRWMRLSQAVVMAGLVLCLFVNPPYPFPYENNLAAVDFVRLHQNAAQFLERHLAGRAITTAWPLSAALRRPEYGYVSRRLAVRELPDFARSKVAALDPGKVEVFVLYSRDWDSGVNLWRWGWFRALRERFYGWEPPVTPEEMEARFPLRQVARWDRRGQWIVVFVRSEAAPKTLRAAGEPRKDRAPNRWLRTREGIRGQSTRARSTPPSGMIGRRRPG
jgi:4-amino-4-deoxy-L-arabinose transferase-like glycosyltransferase